MILLKMMELSFCGCFSLAGKDGRGKKSRKQKSREINQKGETKEGSEMDAFTDKVK